MNSNFQVAGHLQESISLEYVIHVHVYVKHLAYSDVKWQVIVIKQFLIISLWVL